MPLALVVSPFTRSRVTLSEYRSRVRRDLGLTGSSWLADADLNDWGNEAQELFAVETNWYRATQTMNAVAGTADYDLPSNAAARALMIEQVWFDSRVIEPTSFDRIARRDINWRNESGTPVYYLLRGSSAITLYPKPASAGTDNILVLFAAVPPRVSADGDQFYVPHGFDHYLVDYGCAKASLKDAHGEGARRLAIYEPRWREGLDRGKRKVHEVNREDEVVLGEDALVGGSLVGGYLPAFTSISAP